ncbi:basic amino acid ABC transporter substrate-binding protein [Herbaspirillum sp. LeCh32-8]|uniref:basic amino acid ABC transporter substrate-binding protein n=1 Tax=Herbaspirillum sp. LeCh32-8 TaxID=2821356 RepID=UPI001AE7EFAF|nr:basic amino acid ABC transporter substrate-binding protein [Herbaspirillum sp. LeCh32-8]MBP0600889.1 basic amino acid ABC transporter substrate-binding protein [Herbaspirillum sp. LeCh32-8]
MSFKKFMLIAASALAMTVAAGAQAADQTYVVGAGGTYRPFEFENPKKELIGFDIDLIKAIAAASNFKIKLVSTPWEGIFATLGQGDRDIIISGITITDKRAQMVDFSLPYFPAEQVIITNADAKAANLADLKKLQVAVVNSSAGDIVVSEELGKASTSIRRFDNTILMLEELYRGGADAAVGDLGVIKFYVKSHPEKKFKLVTDQKFVRQYFGIAVKKGNKELQDKIDSGLKKIVANGTYAKIYKEWFDGDVPALPWKQ